MINKIMNKEINGVKISVVQFKDYLWMGEPSFEVAIVDADDVKVIGAYETKEEALKVAEELVAQATVETVEADVVEPVLNVEDFAKILEAYDFSIEEATRLQTEMLNSITGQLSPSIKKYMWERYGHSMDKDYTDLSAQELLYNNIGEFLELTMCQVNIYNTEFNKFFSYWMPKKLKK